MPSTSSDRKSNNFSRSLVSPGRAVSSGSRASYFTDSSDPPPVPKLNLRDSAKGRLSTPSLPKSKKPLAHSDGGRRQTLVNDGESDRSKPDMSLKSSLMRSAIDDRNGNQNLEVGDTVDVPGGMHGTIKFIGEVRGKKGTFAGVELAREWAARGKNDGDVDGVRYFTTTIKGAGIFLPSNKAYRRLSSTLSVNSSMPPTPTTPSQVTYGLNGKPEKNPLAQSVTSAPKFSQSVGPGRVPSPTMRSKRPSLPRPDSPQRRAQNTTSTPQPKPSLGKPNLSKSLIGTPRHAPSPTPNRFGGSIRGTKDLMGDPGKKAQNTPRPAIRKPTGVRPPSPVRNDAPPLPPLGPEPLFDEEPEPIPPPLPKPQTSARESRQTSRPNSDQDGEIKSLKRQLEERDKQLERYASDLDEMQNSLTELQTLSPKPGSLTNRSSRGSGTDSLDAPSLRALVREKDEKITTLIREFDSHRADFRETIDILEHTADETNRHYEDRLASLETQLREQTDREGDVQSVAEQLLTLERHVEELEEGLEDSRRGESEARAEVEHLRGEVERGKAEMRREKERSATHKSYGGDSQSEARLQREISHRDNEINGLKAIIHSLSRDPASASPSSPKSSRRSKHDSANQRNSQSESQNAEERRAREKMEREIKELQDLIDRKTYREEELENEVRRLRKHSSQLSSAPSNTTTIPNHNANHNSSGSNANGPSRPADSHSRSQSWRDRHVQSPTANDGAEDNQSSTTHLTDNSALYCDMCETYGHDILHCTTMSSTSTAPRLQPAPSLPSSQAPPVSSHKTPTANGAPYSRSQHQSPSIHDFPTPGEIALGSGGNGFSGRDKHDIGPVPKNRMPDPTDSGMVAGKESGIVDASKWCALCERDGHESVDCPFDNDF